MKKKDTPKSPPAANTLLCLDKGNDGKRLQVRICRAKIARGVSCEVQLWSIMFCIGLQMYMVAMNKTRPETSTMGISPVCYTNVLSVRVASPSV